jgi:hypothetical protein
MTFTVVYVNILLFGPKTGEGTGSLIRLRNEELHNFFNKSVRVLKSRKMSLTGIQRR